MNFKMGVPGCECCGCLANITTLAELLPSDVVSLGVANADLQIDLKALVEKNQGFPLTRSHEVYIDFEDEKNTRITLSVKSVKEVLVDENAPDDLRKRAATRITGWGDACIPQCYGELYYVDAMVATLTSDEADPQEFAIGYQEEFQFQERQLHLYDSSRTYVETCHVRTYKKFWDKAIQPAFGNRFIDYPLNLDVFAKERTNWYGDLDSPTRDNKFFLAHTDGKYKDPFEIDPSLNQSGFYHPNVSAGDFYYFRSYFAGAAGGWQQISPYNKQSLPSSAIEGQPQQVGVDYCHDGDHAAQWSDAIKTTNTYLPRNIGPQGTPSFGDRQLSAFSNDEVIVQVIRPSDGEEQTFYIYDDVADQWSEHTFGKDNRVCDFTTTAVGDEALTFQSDQREMTAYNQVLPSSLLPTIKFRDNFIELSTSEGYGYDYGYEMYPYPQRTFRSRGYKLRDGESTDDAIEGPDVYWKWIPIAFDGMDVFGSEVTLSSNMSTELPDRIVTGAAGSPEDFEESGESFDVAVNVDGRGTPASINYYITLDAVDHSRVSCVLSLPAGGTPVLFDAGELAGSGEVELAIEADPVPEQLEGQYVLSFTEERPDGSGEEWEPTLKVTKVEISYSTKVGGIETVSWSEDDLQNENQCTAVYSNMDCLDADTCSSVSNHGHQQWGVQITSPSSHIRFSEEENKRHIYDGCTTRSMNPWLREIEQPVLYFDAKETTATYSERVLSASEVDPFCNMGTLTGNSCTFSWGSFSDTTVYAQYGEFAPSTPGARGFTTAFACVEDPATGDLESQSSSVFYSSWSDESIDAWDLTYISFQSPTVYTLAIGGETSWSSNFEGTNAGYYASVTVTCEKDQVRRPPISGFKRDRYWQRKFPLSTGRQSVAGDCIFELTDDFEYEQYVSERPAIRFVKQYSILEYNTSDLTSMSGYDDNYIITQEAMMNPATTRTWYFAVLEAPAGTTGWGPEEFNTDSTDPQSDYAPFVHNDYDLFTVSGGLLRTVQQSYSQDPVPLQFKAQQSGDMIIDFEFGNTNGGARIYNSAFDFGYETLYGVTGGSITVPRVVQGQIVTIYLWKDDGAFAAISRVSQTAPKRQYWKWEPQKIEPEYHSEYDGVEPPDITPNGVENSVESSGDVLYQGLPYLEPRTDDSGWINQPYRYRYRDGTWFTQWVSPTCIIPLEDRVQSNAGYLRYNNAQQYIINGDTAGNYQWSYESFEEPSSGYPFPISDSIKFVSAPDATVPSSYTASTDLWNGSMTSYLNSLFLDVTETPTTVSHIGDENYCPGPIDNTPRTTSGYAYSANTPSMGSNWPLESVIVYNDHGATPLMAAPFLFGFAEPGDWAYPPSDADWEVRYSYNSYKTWVDCWSNDDAAYDRDPVQFDLGSDNVRTLTGVGRNAFGAIVYDIDITKVEVLTGYSLSVEARSTSSANQVRCQREMEGVTVDVRNTTVTIAALPNWTYKNEVPDP